MTICPHSRPYGVACPHCFGIGMASESVTMATKTKIAERFMRESNSIEGEYEDDGVTGKLYQFFDIYSALTAMHYAEKGACFSETHILCIHKDIFESRIGSYAGRYRDVQVRVGNYFPPVAASVPYLMGEYFQKLPEMDAWTAHNEFEKIHPFVDGNGRIGRLIWLSKMPEYTEKLSFLHEYYYQTLSHYEQ